MCDDYEHGGYYSTKLPEYWSSGASCVDLESTIEKTIEPMEIVAIPTGLAMEIPEGFEGQVRSRSGMVLSRGLAVANAPGTIDSDYRGEIKVILINLSGRTKKIDRGDRIAQLAICRVEQVEFEDGYISETERGEGGFGSTGL